MKRIFLLYFFIAGCLILTCKPTAKPEIRILIQIPNIEKLDAALPDIIKAPIIIPVDTKATARKLQKSFRLEEKIKEEENLYKISKGQTYLEINKNSSALFFGEMDRLWAQEPIPGKNMKFKVPSDKEVKKATIYLLKEKLGLPENEFKNIIFEIQNEYFEILKSDQEMPTKVLIGKTVRINRKINKLPVVGPGSKIKVYFSDKTKPNGWFALWRSVDPSSSFMVLEKKQAEVKEVPRKKLISAIEELKENPLNRLIIADVDEIEVNQVELAYYAKAATSAQHVFQPVYFFSGVLKGGSETKRPFKMEYRQYVPAIEKILEPIWETGRVFKPEPRKKLNIPIDEDEKVD